jgi:hypothetical protein
MSDTTREQHLNMAYTEGAVIIDYLRGQIARMDADRKIYEARIADLEATGDALRQELRKL